MFYVLSGDKCLWGCDVLEMRTRLWSKQVEAVNFICCCEWDQSHSSLQDGRVGSADILKYKCA